MNSRQKMVQYLSEAHATEQALTRTLQAHIAMTPQGEYRDGLERHLTETESHAERTAGRLEELGSGRGVIELGVGLVRGLVGQTLALAKGPLDVLRGASGEEKLLKNAKDECATEALEIATYEALEYFARRIGDEKTAELAADIRADEERMLSRLREQLPKLVDAVVRSELEGEKVYEVKTTGAAQTARSAGRRAESTAKTAQRTARRGASKAESGGRKVARQARRAPGVARAEGEVKVAVAGAGDLPVANYDSLTAEEISQRVSDLSQVELGKVDAYERKNDARSTVLDRIASLRGDEPWAGYDEQNVEEIRKALSGASEEKAASAVAYERRHKARRGVLEAAESKAGAPS
ncbi:DUF892 family protein [Thermoleophilia bacterium SCSIO 60948]|nr:DUF892 family protein [Thermoleophilia bacterium SCSIO 60948]